MSDLKYNNPPTGIKRFADAMYYTQTVELGNNIVKCSGQGGWTIAEGPLGPIPDSAAEQVENAFANIDQILKEAGVTAGAKDVYLIRTYHLDIDETLEMVSEGLKKWVEHRPLWTALGVPRLADKRMKIEIEVEAKKSE